MRHTKPHSKPIPLHEKISVIVVVTVLMVTSLLLSAEGIFGLLANRGALSRQGGTGGGFGLRQASTGPALRQSDPSGNPSARPSDICDDPNPNKSIKLAAEVFDYYNEVPEEIAYTNELDQYGLPLYDRTITSPYLEQYSPPSMYDHLWRAMASSAAFQLRWTDPVFDPSKPGSLASNLQKVLTNDYAGGRLRGVRLGDNFTYHVGMWPGRGVWNPANIPIPEWGVDQGTYHVREVSGHIACPKYFWVIEYDPSIVSVDAVNGGQGGGQLAWATHGQLGFFMDTPKFCAAHCDPADSSAFSFADIRAHIIGDPGAAKFRPFKVTMINAHLTIPMPTTLDGNSQSRKVKVDDQYGVRWQLQEALDYHPGEVNPSGVLPASDWPTTAEITEQLGRVLGPKTSLAGYSLMTDIRGFQHDPVTQKSYFMDSIGYGSLIPLEHIIAQNAGTERIMQNIVGPKMMNRIHAYLVETATAWPINRLDLATKPDPVISMPEKGLAGTGCTAMREIPTLGGWMSTAVYHKGKGVASFRMNQIAHPTTSKQLSLPSASSYLLVKEGGSIQRAFFKFFASMIDSGRDGSTSLSGPRLSSTCETGLQADGYSVHTMP